jgi:hypothetical protein
VVLVVMVVVVVGGSGSGTGSGVVNFRYEDPKNVMLHGYSYILYLTLSGNSCSKNYVRK